MRFSAACCLAFVLEAAFFPAPLLAASVPTDTLSISDERDYSWPGTPPVDGKPLMDSIAVNPGYAESPIMPFGDCVYIDNQGDPFTLSFKTKEEWENFKKNPPPSVALHACCPHQAMQNPCKEQAKTLGAGRVGAFATLVFSPSYVHVYRCEAISDFLAAWKLVGENTLGGCPPANAVFPTVSAASCPSFLKDSTEQSFPDGTSVIVPDSICKRNYVCMNGAWQQTSWWSESTDITRHTGPSQCY